MPAVERPEFLPDPALDSEEMAQLQHEIAATATFENELAFDPAAASGPQQTLADTGRPPGDVPIIAGVDQAFPDEECAASAIVALQDGEVIETTTAFEPVDTPYIPGLLAFREGGSIVSALEQLTVDPDLLLVDGSGRVHYREAGLATHIGVVFDLPALGVAKSLLCGTPTGSIDHLTTGERVPIEADNEVTAPDGTTIGHAVQTRQFESSNRSINPVYVSPGHRVCADTAVQLVLSACDKYKLPEPIRQADTLAGEQ